MVGSEVEEQNILSHFQAAMLMVTREYNNDRIAPNNEHSFPPEFACLRLMMLEPQNPTMWNSMALVYIMTGRIDDALDAIERSLDLDTGNSWTWSIWGDILDILDNHIESERAYRMALELGSEDPHILRQLVRLYIRRGNLPDALRILEELIHFFPSDQYLWDQYTDFLQSIV
ncbi:tetratricopeptide repeat protein [Candidatus Thorarchaeota archaeon]|nr:MAG: tetratricopeptide repeat protein [Candidatus Thorarchaeota archaeon]